MSKKYNWIHEFSAYVEKEIDVTETKEENGEKIVITKKSRAKVPVFFGFKKPSRDEREESEAHRVSMWSKFVERGILPEAILLKVYSNYGGILSENEKKEYNNLRADLLNKMTDLQRAQVQEQDPLVIRGIATDIINLRDKIIQFEREQAVFFENTAEAKSRNKLIEYLILNFTYTRNSPDEEWKPYFVGEKLEDKYNHLDKLEESRDEIYMQIREKLSLIGSLYVSLGGDVNKGDIETFDPPVENDKPAKNVS